MDTGPERIQDKAELAQVRWQARKVRIESTLVAAILTAVIVAIPSWR